MVKSKVKNVGIVIIGIKICSLYHIQLDQYYLLYLQLHKKWLIVICWKIKLSKTVSISPAINISNFLEPTLLILKLKYEFVHEHFFIEKKDINYILTVTDFSRESINFHKRFECSKGTSILYIWKPQKVNKNTRDVTRRLSCYGRNWSSTRSCRGQFNESKEKPCKTDLIIKR